MDVAMGVAQSNLFGTNLVSCCSFWLPPQPTATATASAVAPYYSGEVR